MLQKRYKGTAKFRTEENFFQKNLLCLYDGCAICCNIADYEMLNFIGDGIGHMYGFGDMVADVFCTDQIVDAGVFERFAHVGLDT